MKTKRIPKKFDKVCTEETIEKFREVSFHFKNSTNLAKILEVHLTFVSMWSRGRKEIPLKYAIKIQLLSNGKFNFMDLVSEKTRCYLQNT
jgi:hypothetical protein